VARFLATSDLKSHFDTLKNEAASLLGDMQAKVKEINDFNTNAAGHDDIGKQYHSTVDDPTTSITTLLDQVRTALDKIGANGQDAADLFNKTDQDLTDSVNGS
jgi:uncharacterized protein YoxC